MNPKSLAASQKRSFGTLRGGFEWVCFDLEIHVTLSSTAAHTASVAADRSLRLVSSPYSRSRRAPARAGVSRFCENLQNSLEIARKMILRSGCRAFSVARSCAHERAPAPLAKPVFEAHLFA
jgi:hypothetical protein